MAPGRYPVEGFWSGGIITQDLGLTLRALGKFASVQIASCYAHKKAPNSFGAHQLNSHKLIDITPNFFGTFSEIFVIPHLLDPIHHRRMVASPKKFANLGK